jgi:hypothetical protein
MPRVSVNGGVTGDRNKSVNQYGACLAVRILAFRALPVFVASL